MSEGTTNFMNGFTTYNAESVEKAVEMAQQFKQEGRYDWFRGQVRDWPPHSSLLRRQMQWQPSDSQHYRRRIGMFYQWLGTHDTLRYLQDEARTSDFFAVLQHYGVPTHYIDFTSEPGVAGFFATDTTDAADGHRACIYCVDTRELLRVWKPMKDLPERRGAAIELIKIEVQNLWRLQAQHGVFLYAPHNWDIDFPMDRILFPRTGPPPFPTKEDMYPTHKSALEQLLDQYFDIERSTFANEWMREWVTKPRERGGLGGSYSEWESFPKGFYEEAFLNPEMLVPLDSWSPAKLQAWGTAIEEKYHDTKGPLVRLSLRPITSPQDLQQAVTYGVQQVLRGDKTIRNKAVDWSVQPLSQPLTADDLCNTLRLIWNGMRRLPYSDDEIAEACGGVAGLKAWLARTSGDNTPMKTVADLYGPGMDVGFAAGDGCGSKGYVSFEALTLALRPDLNELLKPEFRKRVENIRDYFQIIYNPKLMFDFDQFRRLFATKIIPSQAAIGRNPILFNPAHLITFGIP